MFDKLVESTKSRQGRRASRYLVVTTAVYGLALLALAIGTVIGFSPALAEPLELTTMLTPPVPTAPALAPVVQTNAAKANAPVQIFAPSPKPVPILPPDEAAKVAPRPRAGDFAGLPPCNSCTSKPGVFGGRTEPDPDPPPPIVTRESKSKPDSSSSEAKPSGPSKVSEGVLQGGAIRKPKPAYPQIAKAAHASGPVQVVVTISEEGRVIEAYATNGNPLLRNAAVEAARQWVFSPTTLSRVPVKVQGVLTFNFVLE